MIIESVGNNPNAEKTFNELEMNQSNYLEKFDFATIGTNKRIKVIDVIQDLFKQLKSCNEKIFTHFVRSALSEQTVTTEQLQYFLVDVRNVEQKIVQANNIDTVLTELNSFIPDELLVKAQQQPNLVQQNIINHLVSGIQTLDNIIQMHQKETEYKPGKETEYKPGVKETKILDKQVQQSLFNTPQQQCK